MANTTIRVDPGNTIAHAPNNFAGINVNYLVDHDDNRPTSRPLAAALTEMGVKILRFPGGEKSDFHLWSQWPWEMPNPKVCDREDLAYRQVAEHHELLDFDDYMNLAHAVKAQPYIVTAYDNFERTGMNEQQFIENATAWVQYANLKKKYKIRYWEIGNENWHNNTGAPEEVAGVVQRFSKAMKKIDPSIFIGASGSDLDWWERFLPEAAPHIDFLSVSNYGCENWKSFDHYRRNSEVDLATQARIASEAIASFAPEDDRERLFLVAAELNSMDYSKGGWPNHNNLGHALATIELYGQLLLLPRVRHAMLWNTRWVDWQEPQEIWYALGPDNEILPSGRAVMIWGKFLRDRLIDIERTHDIVSFASMSNDKKQINVFLTNKVEKDQAITLTIQGMTPYREATVCRLSGNGPQDMNPKWQDLGTIPVQGNTIEDLLLANTSFTLLSLRR